MIWRVAILRCGQEQLVDEANIAGLQVLREIIEEDISGEIIEVRTVAPEIIEVTAAMYEMIDYHRTELVITLGGIGIAATDIVPEAAMRVIERPLPGVAEAIRAAALQHDPQAMLNRAVAGIKGSALILNLPDDPTGIVDSMQVVMPVLYSTLKGLRQA